MKLGEKIGLLASQAVNAFFFKGDPDESLSARAWRENRTTWISRIDKVCGKDHCYQVYQLQVIRARTRVSVKR